MLDSFRLLNGKCLFVLGEFWNSITLVTIVACLCYFRTHNNLIRFQAMLNYIKELNLTEDAIVKI
jgi:hypothetical protein